MSPPAFWPMGVSSETSPLATTTTSSTTTNHPITTIATSSMESVSSAEPVAIQLTAPSSKPAPCRVFTIGGQGSSVCSHHK